MDVTELPMVTDVRAGQRLNALFPMDVTEVGMVIVAKEQIRNAEDPMDVTESGMVMDAREVQPENARLPMVVTEPRSTDVREVHYGNA